MRYVLCVLLFTMPTFAAETSTVKEGQPAPNFDLPATLSNSVVKDKKNISLTDLKGKNIVLFFYPKAMTSGCTKQCKNFTALKDEFAKTDTIAIGISTDKLSAQEQFMQKDSLAIPLLADPEMTVTKAYGVLRTKGNVANRVTFVIDKKGIVRKIYNPANAEKNAAETLKFVKDELK